MEGVVSTTGELPLAELEVSVSGRREHECGELGTEVPTRRPAAMNRARQAGDDPSFPVPIESEEKCDEWRERFSASTMGNGLSAPVATTEG